MNGAQALLRTLLDSGVDTCFANPGTSEMHIVGALAAIPDMRAVLGLAEGVVTGAADGYARLADGPAATLLHLGPGLANGLANLHNARRAHSPVVNVVGDHATFHKAYDAPLESDIDALAGTVSGWVRRPAGPGAAGGDAAEAVAAARTAPGSVATLIVPADIAWSDGGMTSPPAPVPAAAQVPDDRIHEAAAALTGNEPAALLLGGPALRGAALRCAARVAARTGAHLFGETFPARQQRGAGLPEPDRLPYLPEGVIARLDGLRHLVLVGARSPVSFFAYPGVPGSLVPDGCTVHVLADPGEDIPIAMAHLADRVGADADPPLAPSARPALPDGPLTAESVAAAVGALLPEGAVVIDEANTSGLWLSGATAGAPPHDWLTLTGGAIGQGLPVAVGAAVARPDRPVLCLEADGSAMYTIAALWTQAREGLDVTTVLLNNGSYAILRMEHRRLIPDGPTDLFDLGRPDLDVAAIAGGLGVPATRAHTAEEFTTQLRRALAEPGPHLIDAVIPPLV